VELQSKDRGIGEEVVKVTSEVDDVALLHELPDYVEDEEDGKLVVDMQQHGDCENDRKWLQVEAEQYSVVPNHKEGQACCPVLDDAEADDADMLEELPCFIENNEDTEHGQKQIENLFFIIQQGYQLLGGEVFSFEHVHGSFSEPKLENHEHLVHEVETTISLIEIQELEYSDQQEEKESEQRHEINHDDLHVTSRGCPIRHLAQLETHQEESPLVMLTSKHEVEHQNGWDQPIYSPQVSSISNQSRWIGEFITILWGMFYQFVICPSFPCHFLTAHMHEKHCKLLRKGSYFQEPVNGFV